MKRDTRAQLLEENRSNWRALDIMRMALIRIGLPIAGTCICGTDQASCDRLEGVVPCSGATARAALNKAGVAKI